MCNSAPYKSEQTLPKAFATKNAFVSNKIYMRRISDFFSTSLYILFFKSITYTSTRFDQKTCTRRRIAPAGEQLASSSGNPLRVHVCSSLVHKGSLLIWSNGFTPLLSSTEMLCCTRVEIL